MAVAALVSSPAVLVLTRMLQVRRDVGRARLFWSVPQGDAEGLLYVALGDSAAQGVGASTPDRGYVGLLAERLRESTGRPVEVVNLSVSGACVVDVLEHQLPRLQALQPDVVTVAVGGNDVRLYRREEFTADFERLVVGLPSGSYVADVPWFLRARGGRKAADAAQVVRDVVAAAGLVAVPLHARLQAEGWRGVLTLTSRDLFHPNDRGHEVWADAFWSGMGSPAPGGPY